MISDVLTAATPHVVQAALQSARLIDASGSPQHEAHQAYVGLVTGGIYPPEDIERGENLLLRCGLVRREGGTLVPTAELLVIIRGSDVVAKELVLRRLLDTAQSAGQVASEADINQFLVRHDVSESDRADLLESLVGKYDSVAAERAGAVGEEAVVAQARAELEAVERSDLANQVQRVSLVSDRLGYDVLAPRVFEDPSHLEVKSSGRVGGGLATVFLSRREADVGLRDACWALVVCRYAGGTAEVLGWCRGPSLVGYLPTDTGGRWESVRVDLPLGSLHPGLPSPL